MIGRRARESTYTSSSNSAIGEVAASSSIASAAARAAPPASIQPVSTATNVGWSSSGIGANQRTLESVAPDPESLASLTSGSVQVAARRAADSVLDMAVDVTDATFQADVVDRSMQSVVIVDLWAPWCGPCRTLSPIIEKVVDDTNGKAVLVKVNIDENPAISQAFRVQSIPAVYALRDGQIVDGFMGALPEIEVRQFVERLLPTAEDDMVARMIAMGDEGSLRAVLEIDPANEDAIVGLAELLIARGENEEALGLVARI